MLHSFQFSLSNKKCGPHIIFAYSIISLTSASKMHHNSYMPKHGWLSRLLQKFAGENLDNNQR